MRMRRLLGVVAAVVLLAAGCGDDEPSAQRAAEPSPASSSPSLPADGASPTAASGSSGSGGGGGTATSAPAGAPAAGSSAQAQPGGDSAPAAAPGAPSNTAPGTYTYDTSGTVTAGASQPVDGTATLTVDPPAGGKQHSVLEGEQGRTEQDVVRRGDGTYLARLSLTNPAFTKEFLPTPAVLLVPHPAAVGRTWSWTATSTDGKTKAAVSSRVRRTETLTIGGTRTETAVIETTLRLTGDISYTAQMQTWYDPAHRLTVKDHTKGSGTVGGFAFATDITTVLRSTEPA